MRGLLNVISLSRHMAISMRLVLAFFFFLVFILIVDSKHWEIMRIYCYILIGCLY